MIRQVVLDTETTGLSPADDHRIIEIGCVELIDRRLTGLKFHKYINPNRKIDSEAQAVHGITSEFLQDKPHFVDIQTDFTNFVDGAELIIHNAPFDVGFINHELSKIPSVIKNINDNCGIIDSLLLAKQLHPGQRNSLDALCKRYGIDNSKRELHGALLDAFLLAHVYLSMTGGQTSLFSTVDSLDTELSKDDKKSNDDIAFKVSAKQEKPLRVIYADESELAQHNKKLAELCANGSCVWDSKG